MESPAQASLPDTIAQIDAGHFKQADAAIGQALAQPGLSAQTRQDWLFDETLVLPALIFTAIWLRVPLNIIFYLAALQGVEELGDARRRIVTVDPLSADGDVLVVDGGEHRLVESAWRV